MNEFIGGLIFSLGRLWEQGKPREERPLTLRSAAAVPSSETPSAVAPLGLGPLWTAAAAVADAAPHVPAVGAASPSPPLGSCNQHRNQMHASLGPHKD